MAGRSTPPTGRGDARHAGLRRARVVAAGASVGAAVVLTGTIAAVNAAPSGPATPSGSGTDGTTRTREPREIDDEEYAPARPFTPQYQSPSPAPQLLAPAQPQTRSRGS